jgi:hypothetical protein
MPPLELVTGVAVWLVIPCLVAGGGVLAIAARLLEARWMPVAVSSATAAALLAGNATRDIFPWLPEYTGWPWLLAAALLALIGPLVASRREGNVALGVMVSLGVAALVAARVVPEELHSPSWLFGFVALAAANGMFLVGGARGLSGGAVPLAAASILGGGAAIVSIFAHSARFADAGTLLAAALAAIALPAWRWRLDASAALAAPAVFVPGLMLADDFETFSEVPRASFALVAAAPLMLALLQLPAVKRWPDSWRKGLFAGLLLLPVATAVTLAIWHDDFSPGY